MEAVKIQQGGLGGLPYQYKGTLNAGKIARDLGWCPQVTLEEGFRRPCRLVRREEHRIERAIAMLSDFIPRRGGDKR